MSYIEGPAIERDSCYGIAAKVLLDDGLVGWVARKGFLARPNRKSGVSRNSIELGSLHSSRLRRKSRADIAAWLLCTHK